MDDASIFFLASLPKKLYALAERVFSCYSLGQLKGQTSKRGSLGKRMDLKGNNFKPLRGLEMEVVEEVLTEVTEKMSLKEMYCIKVKNLKRVQKVLVEATSLDS